MNDDGEESPGGAAWLPRRAREKIDSRSRSIAFTSSPPLPMLAPSRSCWAPCLSPTTPTPKKALR